MAIQLTKTGSTPSLAPSVAPSVAASLTPSATLATSEVVNIQNSPESPQTTQPNLIQRATSAMIRSPSCIGIVTRTLIRGTVGFLSGFTIGAAYGAASAVSDQGCDFQGFPLDYLSINQLKGGIALAKKEGYLCSTRTTSGRGDATSTEAKKTVDNLYKEGRAGNECRGKDLTQFDLYNAYITNKLNINNSVANYGLIGGVTGAIVATVLPLFKALSKEESSPATKQVAIEKGANIKTASENHNDDEMELLLMPSKTEGSA